MQASGDSAEVVNETSGERVRFFISIYLTVGSRGVQFHVNQDDITVLGVQAAALPKPKQDHVWGGQRILITRGPFKGYHGLVKSENRDGVEVELDAKLTSHGSKQHSNYGDFVLE